MRQLKLYAIAGIFLCLFFAMMQSHAQNLGQARAMAVRAARADALRQLGEAVLGVRIDAHTTVKDFVTQNDQIQGAFKGFLRGARELGAPKYNDDGTCEVTLGIHREYLIYWLRNAWQKYPHNNNLSSAKQFQSIRKYHPKAMFVATGSGAMAETPEPHKENIWNRVSGRGKLMAIRAAKVDAYRNMAETIKGVHIDAKTTVKDFVTQSDQIRLAFNRIVIIRGVEFVGRPKYRPDGVVEVRGRKHISSLIRELGNICQNHYRGEQWSSDRFQGISNSDPYIYVTGSGVPNKRYIKSTPYIHHKPYHHPYRPKTYPKPILPKPRRIYVPAWANRTVRVTGSGARPDFIQDPGRARLMARRAAQIDGYRQLLEMVLGLKLKSSTKVKDFVTENDQMHTKIKGKLKGAKVLRFREMPDGTVEADLELYLGDMWQIIAQKYYGMYGKYE